VAGQRASRRLAATPRRQQHFLRRSFAAELVRASGVGVGDLVLDLGAGSGRLTAELVRTAGRVVAVELDPRLATSLRRKRWHNVEVVEGDATRVALPREAFRVVANIPFARTNDILHALFDDPRTPLERADLVVEWGVAVKRGLPWPSSISGVVWGATYETSVARRLPPAAFEPPPSVAAGVLVFERRNEPLIPHVLAKEFQRFVAHGFRHGLRSIAQVSALDAIAGRRATSRDLDAHQWATLFQSRRGQS
jgi:23S rRNA (adenine-N6)-dimethyltransferase